MLIATAVKVYSNTAPQLMPAMRASCVGPELVTAQPQLVLVFVAPVRPCLQTLNL